MACAASPMRRSSSASMTSPSSSSSSTSAFSQSSSMRHMSFALRADRRAMRWLALLVVAACSHHDAPAPVEPAGTTPLPPASGTPIGYLIDDASELHLTDDQVTKLRDIDTSLAAELEVIDSQVRQANRPAAPDPS